MPTFDLLDWNNKTVSAVRSKGGVLAFPDYSDNLIRTAQGCWPAPEIVQKLCKSEKLWAFLDDDQEPLSRKLGYYCDLQSVHSEDAMHWSYFGPLLYADEEHQLQFSRWLHGMLQLKCEQPGRCSFAMWRRIPHPDNGTPNGPELDLWISTDTFSLLVESKWRSAEGRWQGADGLGTQIQLRQRFLARYGKALFGDSLLAVLCVVLDDSQRLSGDSSLPIPVLNCRWADLCTFSQHVRVEEVRRYYDWKRNLIARKFGMPAPG